jgi:hypothetical protein
MHLSIASVLGLAIAPALAGCPYARDAGPNTDDKENPHAHLPRDTVPSKSVASVSSATPSAAAGKKGLFLMNHLVPGTKIVYRQCRRHKQACSVEEPHP